MGIRTGRFAIVVDDLTIKYIKVRLDLMPRSFRLTRHLFLHTRLSLGQESPSPELTLSLLFSRMRVAQSGPANFVEITAFSFDITLMRYCDVTDQIIVECQTARWQVGRRRSMAGP